jgi:hypothetical protein
MCGASCKSVRARARVRIVYPESKQPLEKTLAPLAKRIKTKRLLSRNHAEIMHKSKIK